MLPIGEIVSGMFPRMVWDVRPWIPRGFISSVLPAGADYRARTKRMAKFIEYKSNPWWTVLYMLCGAVVIPLLACILFIREVISTTGFVVITACGMGGLFLLNEQVERRTRKVIEVASGKLPKRQRRLWTTSSGSSGKTPVIELSWSFTPSLRCCCCWDFSPQCTGRRGLGLRLGSFFSSDLLLSCMGYTGNIWYASASRVMRSKSSIRSRQKIT